MCSQGGPAATKLTKSGTYKQHHAKWRCTCGEGWATPAQQQWAFISLRGTMTLLQAAWLVQTAGLVIEVLTRR